VYNHFIEQTMSIATFHTEIGWHDL